MIETVSPIGFITVCLIAAAALAWLLYRKSNFQPKSKKILLGSLRFLGLFLVLLLLLSPFFKFKINRTESPYLLVALDQSASVNSENLAWELKCKEQFAALSDKYQVKFCKIGNTTSVLEDSNFSKSKTNLGSLIDFANDVYDGKNISSIVLVSDGINNQGANPLFKKTNKNIPIFSVGLGDTTQYPDALVSNVFANETVFYDNEFSIQTSVRANALANKPMSINLLEDGRVIQNKSWTGNAENSFTEVEFFVKAKNVGIHRYSVQINSGEKERNLSNNLRSIVVNVTDTRRKITLIYDAPNPDVAAISRALEKVTNYTFKMQSAAAAINYSEADIFILHNIPSNAGHLNILNQIGMNQKPALFITGLKTQWSVLNNWNKQFTFNPSDENGTESQAVWNQNFSDFSLPQDLVNGISKLPPLKIKYGNFQGSAAIKSLFFQKLGSVSTPFPLIGFSQKDKTRFAWIFGEGLWKWRMKDYEQNGNWAFTDELIQRTIQFITTNELKQDFKIFSEKSDYEFGDKIVIMGEKFDKDGELNNTDPCDLILTGDNGVKMNLAMGKHGKAYRLDAGALPSGNYEVIANTTGAQKLSAKTRFSIGEFSSELSDLTANHNLLRTLSANTSGKFYLQKNIDKLIDELKNRSVNATIFTEQKITDMIDIKWFFALIILLFSAEWFIRRREGSY